MDEKTENTVRLSKSIFLTICQVAKNGKIWYNKRLGIRKKLLKKLLFYVKNFGHVFYLNNSV